MDEGCKLRWYRNIFNRMGQLLMRFYQIYMYNEENKIHIRFRLLGHLLLILLRECCQSSWSAFNWIISANVSFWLYHTTSFWLLYIISPRWFLSLILYTLLSLSSIIRFLLFYVWFSHTSHKKLAPAILINNHIFFHVGWSDISGAAEAPTSS